MEDITKDYCENCEAITDSQWEIWYCNRNPEGLTTPTDHDLCDDDTCSPDIQEIDNDDPRILESDKYEVHPRCAKCGYLLGY